jgi:hypothetical protein
MTKNIKPGLRLGEGEWYDYAPNNSYEARCLLTQAIGWLTQENQRIAARKRKMRRALKVEQQGRCS